MILVVTPDRNTAGRSDWSGAFRPEADTFLARRGGALVRIDQSLPGPARFRQLMHAVGEHQPTDLVYFGHGLLHSAPQLGLVKARVAMLADALAEHGTAPTVVLYACSSAGGVAPGGEGGLCDAIRDALMTAGAGGARVFGHTSAGHTTMNPNVRVFDGRDELGGRWLVDPRGPSWGAWRRGLRTPLRFDFPWMTEEELGRALACV